MHLCSIILKAFQVADKITVKLRKPLMLEMFLECLFFCKREPIRFKLTKPQPLTPITFVVSGFLLWFHYASDWLKNNNNSRNNNSEWTRFSGFLSNVSNPGHLEYKIDVYINYLPRC